MPLNYTGKPTKSILQQYTDLRNQAPRMVGTMAVNFFKDRFERGGWQDASFKKWDARKNNKTKGKTKKRAILVQTGRLRRSIRITHVLNNSVHVGTDVPYAQLHNEGGSINTTASVRAHTRKGKKGKSHAVKAHTRKVLINITQRQFMGNSDFLNRRIQMNLIHKLKQIFQ